MSRCNNCRKLGHFFYHCKFPITSFGIILFRYNAIGETEFLMMKRKNTYGYIDFIRGRYSVYNRDRLLNIFNEMTVHEKESIKNGTFNCLWVNMWEDVARTTYQKLEESGSEEKFRLLKNGVLLTDGYISLEWLIDNSDSKWTDQEWDFPKGRRNINETDKVCAIREFEEETGLNRKNIDIIDNIHCFEEGFIGTNHKSYKNKFFLAHASNKWVPLNNFQTSEVSGLCWKTLNQCLESIRPYNLEKKQSITNIYKILNDYTLY